MAIVAAWAFPSSSGATVYETTLSDLGTIFCNCPGFLYKKRDQPRGCKHTRQIQPYAAQILNGTLTQERLAQWLGVSGVAVSAGDASVSPASSNPTPSSSPSVAPSPATTRRIDFEE